METQKDDDEQDADGGEHHETCNDEDVSGGDAGFDGGET
jgi:hypothetical protein